MNNSENSLELNSQTSSGIFSGSGSADLSARESIVESLNTGESIHESERSLQEASILSGQNSNSAPDLLRIAEIFRILPSRGGSAASDSSSFRFLTETPFLSITNEENQDTGSLVTNIRRYLESRTASATIEERLVISQLQNFLHSLSNISSQNYHQVRIQSNSADESHSSAYLENRNAMFGYNIGNNNQYVPSDMNYELMISPMSVAICSIDRLDEVLLDETISQPEEGFHRSSPVVDVSGTTVVYHSTISRDLEEASFSEETHTEISHHNEHSFSNGYDGVLTINENTVQSIEAANTTEIERSISNSDDRASYSRIVENRNLEKIACAIVTILLILVTCSSIIFYSFKLEKKVQEDLEELVSNVTEDNDDYFADYFIRRAITVHTLKKIRDFAREFQNSTVTESSS